MQQQIQKIKRKLPKNIKVLVKKFIWSKIIPVQKFNDKDLIFIHTSRRSGGTWLCELINSSIETRFISEPFATEYKNFNAFSKKFYDNGIIYKDNVDYAFNIFEEIKNSAKGSHIDFKFFKKKKKILIKIHQHKLAIVDIINRYKDPKHIILIRNPKQQAISSMKLKSRKFYNEYRNTIVPNEIFEKIDSYKFTNEVSQYLINWYLENYSINFNYNNLKSFNNVKILNYNSLKTNFAFEIDNLSNFLGFKIHKTNKLSKTTNKTNNPNFYKSYYSKIEHELISKIFNNYDKKFN